MAIHISLENSSTQRVAIVGSGGRCPEIRLDTLGVEEGEGAANDPVRLFTEATNLGFFGSIARSPAPSAMVLRSNLNVPAAQASWEIALRHLPPGAFWVLHNLLGWLGADDIHLTTVSPRANPPLKLEDTDLPAAPEQLPFDVDPELDEWNKLFIVRIVFGRPLTEVERDRVKHALEVWRYMAERGAYLPPSPDGAPEPGIDEVYLDVDDSAVLDIEWLDAEAADGLFQALLLVCLRFCNDGIPVVSIECE